MLSTRVYAVDVPNEGPQWVLQWRTATMPGPAFWYFATKDEAEHEERYMQKVHGRKTCVWCGASLTREPLRGGCKCLDVEGRGAGFVERRKAREPRRAADRKVRSRAGVVVFVAVCLALGWLMASLQCGMMP